jgi:hypothetical protein
MIFTQLRKKFLGIWLATIVLIFVAGLFFASDAFTATTNYTVCSSGCDFTSLADALNDPGLDGDSLIDTVTLTADYVFNYDAETVTGTDFILNIPSGVTISCDSGADTLGDKNQAEIELSGSTNVTIQNCLTENVKVSLFGDNVNLLGNTFSSETDSWITLTVVDGFEISGNTGIQRIQLQGADNGLIEDNDIECRFSGCINVVTAGAPDYNDPPSIDANICNNVLINNNNITNYAIGNIGDWVLINGGKNIQFTNNTISSAVTMNNHYMTLVTVQNAQAEFTGNYIIAPKKVSTTQATWPFNVRVDEYHIDVLYENNTVYSQYDNDICIGLFDGTNDPNINVDITANYNLCYNGSLTVAGSAISFSYDAAPGNANVTLTDSFNGLYNFTSPYISDDSGIITALNSNTVTSNPFLRTANVTTSDDYYPSPISRYYDVDGTKDIGAHSGVRVTNYLIDDDCAVDYATCFSTTTTILNEVISTGDTVNIATGTYEVISLDSPVNNVTFIGAGANTIFDASGSGSAFSIENITNSSFSNFQVQGSNSNVTTTYAIDHAQYTDGVYTYDESLNLGMPVNSVLILTGPPVANTCNSSVFYDADDFDISTIIDATDSNWNLGLVNYFSGFARFTVLVPDEYVSSATELLGCANPGELTIEYFVDDVYIASNGVYEYNDTAISGVGLSVKPGDTDPPAITRTVVTEESGGLLINNSSGNTFSSITSTDNSYAIVFKGLSASNIIKDSNLVNSTNGDLLTVGGGNNFFEDVLFDRTTVDIMGSGNMNIKYSVRAYIKDTASNALSGAEVSFISANSLDSEILTTVGSGFTPFSSPLLAYTLTSSSLLEVNGGYNPYNITVSLDRYTTKTMSANLNTPLQLVTMTLSGLSSSGGGGIAITTPCVSVNYSQWGTCVNDQQYRDVLNQTPSGCRLTESQESMRSRNCLGTTEETPSNIKSVMDQERELSVKINTALANRLAGRILLQVEEFGQAWYVEPVTKKRYFMGLPIDAFNLMRRFGLGISNLNLKKFQDSGVPRIFASRIFLQVESNGEAYYVNPVNMKMYYLGRPADAFRIMQELSLGITNLDLKQIAVGEEWE